MTVLDVLEMERINTN